DDDGDGIADVNDGMLSLPGNLISGREFHGLVFPENYAVPNQTLNIAGPPGTNVIVSGQSYIISGDGILTVSTNKQHVIPGLNSDASVDVVADADVTVALLSYNVYSADAWTGVPSMVLGTDYTVIGHPTYLSSAWSQLLVAGVEDGTAVEIISRTGAVVDSFTVGSGDTYLYQRDGRIDLTGYSVHASKNVSVGAGSSCLNTGAGACDFVHEQLLPDSYLATEYLVPNLFQNFKTRIVPSVSSTEILVNGVSRGTFDKGSFYEIAGAGLHIETSKPSSVYIITLGGDPRNSGDPSFILLPGADKGVLASTFNVPVPSFTNQLVVVAATDTVEDIVLDGNA
ncbi:MAG: IgGFc-binding protein, partial [Methylococcales bacterium]|nr:IgGFc-binding protein [Methylococcales bacterium]